MAVATFDTLKYANSLKEAGVPGPQAEAQSRALGEALQANFKDLVTKDDLKQAMTELELKLGNRIDAAVAGLTNKIDALIAGLDKKIDQTSAKIEQTAAGLTNKIDQSVAALTNAIDRSGAKTDNVRTELKGETFWLRSLGGILTMLTVGIFVRLFFYGTR